MKTWIATFLMVVGGVVLLALSSFVGWLGQHGSLQALAPGNSPSDAKGNRPFNEAEGNSPDSPKRDPIPDDEPLWEDYDTAEFKNTKRLQNRPGNFEVITLIGQFFEGMYEVEPSFDAVAYPLQTDSKVIESAEQDAEFERAARAAGRVQRNKVRSYNLVFHKVTLLNFEQGDSVVTNAADLGVTPRHLERFAEVRKRHPERCVLSLMNVSWESLQSDKIEANRSDADFILCWVLKEDGWKLVWIEK